MSFVGFEWEMALAYASDLGVSLRKELTSPPRGPGSGTLRVVRQREMGDHILCTCAAEEWGETHGESR